MQNNRHVKILLWVSIIVLAVLIIDTVITKTNNHDNTKNQTTSNQPCSSANAPCIALISNGGQTVAKFNDFRFCGQGCIWYSLNGQWIKYNGGYTLKWIGPGVVPNATQGNI